MRVGNVGLYTICRKGIWSAHSSQCSNEAVTTRHGKRSDKRACQKCFWFSSIQLVKDRVKRMEKKISY